MIDQDSDMENLEMTTLSVPKVFRQKLIDEYQGRNDLERIQKWAEDYEEEVAYENVQKFMRTDDFEGFVSELIKSKLITYNTELRDELERVIEETVRDMRR